MTAFLLAWDRLRSRPAATCAAILAVGIGVATLTMIVGIKKGIEAGLEDVGGHCDIIVGPKGGPMELVLAVSLGITSPQGRVDPGLMRDLKSDYRVEAVAPVMLEDDYKGWRIIATTEDHPIFYGLDNYRDYFMTGDRIAILGKDAAEALNLLPEDTFVSTHESAEDGASFEVVEILGPRDPISNRSIFVPITSIHHHHEKSDSIILSEPDAENSFPANALLVTLKTPLDLIPLLREWNDMPGVTAVDPRSELSRIVDAISSLQSYIWIGGSLLIALASLSIAAIMFSQATERRRAAAILRALGAHFSTLLIMEISASMILTFVGAALGLCTGFIALKYTGVPYTPGKEEFIVISIALLFGLVAAIAASMQLYRVSLDDALRPDR